MSLVLYGHPFSSYTQKALIALYENDVPFEFRCIDPEHPQHAQEWLRRWPMAKFPLLLDGERAVVETSIIIEYLQQHYPGPVALLPGDAEACLQARLWDRFFDLYVSGPMQTIVGDRIRPEGRSDPHGVETARASLQTAYAMADAQLAGRAWATGDAFTMADCAAAPALFYTAILQPFDDRQRNLASYFERLMARPSVARVIDEARPYFPMFPFRDRIPARFLNA